MPEQIPQQGSENQQNSSYTASSKTKTSKNKQTSDYQARWDGKPQKPIQAKHSSVNKSSPQSRTIDPFQVVSKPENQSKSENPIQQKNTKTIQRKSGKVIKTKETNPATGRSILKVVCNVYLYGAAATEERIKLITDDLNAQYNREGNYFTYTIDDILYDVKFLFKIEKKDEKSLEEDILKATIEDNFYYVFDPKSIVGATNSTTTTTRRGGGNLGVLNTEQIDANVGTPSHEINWGFGGTSGLKRRLAVREGKKEEKDLRYKPGETLDISVSHGYRNSEDEKVDINTTSRKVTQDNINDILGKVTFDENGEGHLGDELAKKYRFKPDPTKRGNKDGF